jgi:hypothetical protein
LGLARSGHPVPSVDLVQRGLKDLHERQRVLDDEAWYRIT